MESLASTLLNFFQWEAGLRGGRAKKVGLISTLNSILEAYKLQAHAKGLEFKLQFVGAIPEWIQIDVAKLRHALGNLVVNAIEFTDRGTVAVRVSYSARVLEVTVSDSGPGISLSHVEALFKPYSEGGAIVFSKFGGIRLGLSSARQIAQVLGGDVVLVSSSVDDGSVFRLSVTAETVM